LSAYGIVRFLSLLLGEEAQVFGQATTGAVELGHGLRSAACATRLLRLRTTSAFFRKGFFVLIQLGPGEATLKAFDAANEAFDPANEISK
jgi:hypothetical protein